jgi:antirestriction protein ArdC
MAHPASNRGASNGRTSLYQTITDRIISELEQGRVPWVQPWTTANTGLGMPHNAVTARPYSGINILTLWNSVVARGFSCHAFLTFRQALELGGHVRRGEEGTPVVFAHRFIPKEEKARAAAEQRDTVRCVPFLKQFTLFSVDQCEGLPSALSEPRPPIPVGLILPQAAKLIAATGADFRIGGAMAFYSPAHDVVHVPRPDDFHEPVNWHRTALHELGHWTGHSSRLDRDQSGRFGSKEYGREELVAEMAGAFVCAALGIEPTVRHSDYLGSWLDIMREDNRAIVRAASAASRAADLLLGFAGDPEPDTHGSDVEAHLFEEIVA